MFLQFLFTIVNNEKTLVVKKLGGGSPPPLCFLLGFLARPFTNHRTVRERGGHFFLTPHYHYYPLHRHLDIGRAITAESSLLYIAVCNFQSMKIPVELNNLLSKFFCFITWFVMTRLWTTCKQDLYVKSYCLFEIIA